MAKGSHYDKKMADYAVQFILNVCVTLKVRGQESNLNYLSGRNKL